MRPSNPSAALRLVISLAAVACFVPLAPACDDATAPPDAGTIVLKHDAGVDFVNGTLEDPGNYANSDLYATTNGDSGMKLATGGATVIDNRPITWFKNGGGLAMAFPDLASVPTSPAPTSADAMLHARTGNGFLLVAKNGDLVRGHVSDASATSLTLQWERVGAE